MKGIAVFTIRGRHTQAESGWRYVQMYLENRVSTVSIFLHPQTLSYCQLNVLKLSPKGEGFNPPKM